MTDELSHIESITKLSPVPGDVIVLRIAENEIPLQISNRLKLTFESLFPGVKCVILPAYMELSVLTRQQVDALLNDGQQAKT